MLPKTTVELDQLRDECKSMVTARSSLSAGAAVVPVPGVDIGADIALLVEMIPAINKKFGLSQEQIEQLNPQVRNLIFVAATGVGNEMIGKVITQQLIAQVLKKIGIRIATKSIIKYIPILGSAVAATISFGAMKLIGKSHVDDCYAVVKKILLTTESGQSL